MNSPPVRSSLSLLAVCALLLSTAGVVAVDSADAPAQDSVCDYESYTPPSLDREWRESFVDPLENGSLDNWSGGALARVGGDGDCSLVVGENESVTLTATTVDGNRGVVTGSVDLGANGSLSLVGANETQVSISNPGPGFAHTYRVSAGNESAEQTLSTGRFFEFALWQGENDSVQVALWDAGWDREWDATVENATGAEQLRLRLDGEVFLDGVAVGVEEEPEPTETPPEGDADPEATPTEEEFPATNEDEIDFEVEDPGPSTREPSGSGAGTAIFGVFLMLIGGVSVKFARGMARFGEQLDAIGSKRRWSEVEPADWNVALTKIGGAVAFVIGLVMLLAGIFG
jgi:hypothetical protein